MSLINELKEKSEVAPNITKQEIYQRLSEIYKQGKETGCYSASIFNLMSDIKFDIERSEKK